MPPKKIKTKTIIILILVLTLVGLTDTVYSVLSRRDYSIIRTAFMNGYIEALNLEAEEKQKLQNDQNLLKKTVELAADKYLARVDNLNP